MMQRSKATLPFDLSSFVGRATETDELRAALASSRMVTVTGAGGAGKSRLAVHVARKLAPAFPGGTWLVELDQLEDETLLPHLVISKFGVPVEAGRRPEDALVQLLADKRLLIVLDDCEHLVEACCRLVTNLLLRAPGVRILATSREVVGVPGEVVWAIPPLSLPDPAEAVQPATLSQYEAPFLFGERARAAVPGFAIDQENASAVAELCRRLDGSPLALELAAVQLRVLSLNQILERVDRPFALLRAGGPAGRRQSLRAVVDGSYDLCSEAERRVWAMASVFAGGFDLPAAESVCASSLPDEGDVLTSLAALVDKSVVTVTRQGQASRFRMLETIRRYGAERLAESGEEIAVRRRHRDHYLAVVQRAEREWSGPGQPEWLAYLRRERPNLWSALDFCFAHPEEEALGVGLAGLLWPLWIVGGFLEEGRYWIEQTLSSAAGDDPGRARAASVGALLACLEGDVPRARAMLEDSRARLLAVDDLVLQAIAARAFGTVEMLEGNLTAATPWFERSLACLHEAGTPHSLALVSHADLGVVHGLSGTVEEGMAQCEEGRQACLAQDETWALSWILFVLSFLRLVQDETEDVSADLEGMLRIKVAFNDVLGILQAAELLAWVAALREPRRAARILGATEALWRPLGAFLLSFGPYLARHERSMARVREALGEEAFERELRAGAAMDLDELAAYALNEPVAEPPTPAMPTMPCDDGLTRREREICELVAEGLTDREIADRLVISPRTVQTHVSNILTKLDFRSRVQIAAWATRER